MKKHPFPAIILITALILTLAVCDPAMVRASSISQESSTEESVGLVQTGNMISMARATWDTGWFKAEILKQLLEALGYSITGPKTMDSQDFFLATARGEIDLWVNSWFPSHYSYIEKNRIEGKVEPVGFQVKAGALQGYLIDKKSADRLGITNLSDFKKLKIAHEFDRDGNGKAELIGCNTSWACGQEIEHQLEAYGLRDTVEQVQGDYSSIMVEAIQRYKHGEPLFFYTWTPNWTIGTLVPGKDVIWLQVPFPSLPEGQKKWKARSWLRVFPVVRQIHARWAFRQVISGW